MVCLCVCSNGLLYRPKSAVYESVTITEIIMEHISMISQICLLHWFTNLPKAFVSCTSSHPVWCTSYFKLNWPFSNSDNQPFKVWLPRKLYFFYSKMLFFYQKDVILGLLGRAKDMKHCNCLMNSKSTICSLCSAVFVTSERPPHFKYLHLFPTATSN